VSEKAETGIVRFRSKPKPDRGVIAAKYTAGGSLDGVRRLAAMAHLGEATECALPSGETVLLARYRDVPDNHPSRWAYTIVHSGNWLYYSEDYDSLGEDTSGSLAHWYEPEPEDTDPGPAWGRENGDAGSTG
jgi:hypothetical protein